MAITVYREELAYANSLKFVIQSYAYGSIPDARGVELVPQPGNRVIVPIRLRGKGEYVRDASRTLNLREGFAYFIPKNHPAGLKINPRSVYHVIQFTLTAADGPDLFATAGDIAVLRLAQLSERLRHLTQERNPTLFALELRALAAVFAQKAAAALGTASAQSARLYEHFAPEMKYLDERLTAQTRVSDMAAVRHSRRDAFTRAFIRLTGQTPKAVIEQKLLDRALQLIVEGKLHTDEIAFSLGFNSASNFSRFFKRLTGYPPVRYRRRDPANPLERPTE